MRPSIRRYLGLAAVGMIVIVASAFATDNKAEPSKATKAVATSDSSVVKPDSMAAKPSAVVTHKVIAYYFHTTRRCPSCKKIEAYSDEAIRVGYADQLKAGQLEWRVINTDEPGNEHYVDYYQLYTKSLVLSHVDNGTQTKWKNLDKVWELLGDKDGFVIYVQDDIKAFSAEK